MTSTAADDSGSLQSKFQHLLQPIRDLAQNWNIDIAQDLESYLDQLDDIQVSVDGGQSLVNFAEAALLIQGSACVYSRKVDLLSHLVQHVLDIIFSRKRPDAALDLNVPVAPEGGTEGDFFTAEPEFLALDHVIQGKDTLMKDVNGPSAASAVLPSRAVLGLVTIDGDGSTGMKRASILSQCTPFRMGAMVVDRLLGASLDAAGYNRMSADTSAIAHVPSTPFPAEEQVAQALNFSDSGDMGDDGGDMFEEHHVPASALVNTAAPALSQPFARTSPSASASDPWAPLDPHVANAADNKPLKRGKTWREPKLPTSLIPVTVIKQVRVGLPKVTNFNTPCFGCSQKVFATLRMKAAAQRLQSDPQGEEQQENALVSEDVAASAHDWNAQDDAPFHEELDSDDEAALPPLPLHNAEDAQVPSHQEEQPDLIIDDMHSFQARCRSYMDSFTSGWERFADQSNLAVRVREWQDKLDPLLKDQQSRSAFDIHSYEKQVIGIVSESGKLVQDEDGTQARLCSFSEAVALKPQYEICRCFLAALQLAADGNVVISSASSSDFSLTLHEGKLNERVLQFTAPSVASAMKKRRNVARTGVADSEATDAAARPAAAQSRRSRPASSAALSSENLPASNAVAESSKMQSLPQEHKEKLFF